MATIIRIASVRHWKYSPFAENIIADGLEAITKAYFFFFKSDIANKNDLKIQETAETPSTGMLVYASYTKYLIINKKNNF